VTAARTTVKASAVRLGDTIVMPSGAELTVTRIDANFMARPDMLAFVEDSARQWLKMPVPCDADVEVVLR
jgi:hypothetical protein